MITIDLEDKVSCNVLQKHRKIELMKDILDLSNKEIETSEYELQKQINKIASENFISLILIQNLLAQLPDKLKEKIKKIDKTPYNKKLFEELFKTSAFNDYHYYFTYLLIHECYNNLKSYTSNDNDLIKEKVYTSRQKYCILFYNILVDDHFNIRNFATTEIVYNIPFIYLWAENHKYLPINNLNENECQILAYLVRGGSIDELSNLKLDGINDYNSYNTVINAIPSKFNVDNLTQVLFRIYLLKPFIWCLNPHEKIVKVISQIHNEL